MTTQRDVEHALDVYLGPGDDEVADRVIDGALSTIEHTKQRRTIRSPWRFFDMPQFPKLLATAAAVIVVVAASGWFLSRSLVPSVGTSPPPSTASARPPTPIAVTTTTEFTSSRYWYTVRHPVQLSARPAYGFWELGTALSPTSPGLDTFIGQMSGGEAFFGIASQPLPSNLSPEKWLTDHADLNARTFGESCGGRPSDWMPTTGLGEIGRRAALTCNGLPVTEIVFVHEGRGWIITGDAAIVDGVLDSLVLPR